MKKVFLLTLLVLFGTFEVKAAFKKNEKRILSEQVLKDKVKGAWAGQTLGCSYGGPTEFKFLGTIIQDYIPIPWNEHMVKKWYHIYRNFSFNILSNIQTSSSSLPDNSVCILFSISATSASFTLGRR